MAISVSSPTFGNPGGAITIAAPAGSTIVVAAITQASGTFSGAGSVSDSASNAYSNPATYSNSSYTAQMDLFYAENVSAATSVTYTLPSGATRVNFGVAVWVLTPTGGTIAFASAGLEEYLGSTTTGANAITTGTLNVSTPGGIVLGLAADFTNPSLTAGTGMTQDGTAYGQMYSEHASVSTPTACTWTDAVANETVLVAGIGFNFIPPAAYVYQSTGTVVHAYNTGCTPTISGQSAGDLLLLHSGEYMGADSAPAAPAGWTNITPTSHGQAVYARWASGTSADNPTCNSWGGEEQFAYIVDYTSTYGEIPLNEIVVTSSDRYNSSATTAVYNATTISQNFCLAIAFANRNVSTAGASSTPFSSISNFTLRANAYHSATGGGTAIAFNEWMQTVATNIALTSQNINGTDSSTQAYEGTILVLQPGTGGAPPASGGGTQMMMGCG